MLYLPTAQELESRRVCPSKGDLAREIYPSLTYDTALPIGFTEALRRHGFDLVSQFVWGYPEGGVLGRPYPLTEDALHALSFLATFVD